MTRRLGGSRFGIVLNDDMRSLVELQKLMIIRKRHQRLLRLVGDAEATTGDERQSIWESTMGDKLVGQSGWMTQQAV